MISLIECCILGLGGIASHLCLFIRGEYHLLAPTILRVYLCCLIALFIIHIRIFDSSGHAAAVSTACDAGVYAGALFASMTIYRLKFHRLKNFRGPVLARLSKFYHAWNVRHFDQCYFLDRLHRQYGDFVRTGPSEITIFTPEAIPEVLGSTSMCSKSLWWEMMWPEVSMITTRSEENHESRRKAWDQGFSIAALRSREPVVVEFVDRFESLLRELAGKPINVTQWFELYTFDVMGAINFSFNFDMLRTRQLDPAVEVFKVGMLIMGPFTPLPWLFHIATSIPGLQKGWLRFKNWADERLQSRLKKSPSPPDMISWAIKHSEKEGGSEYRHNWLLSDVICLLSAASEPVLCVMVFLFYHLSLDPAQAEKLRNELSTVNDISSHDELQGLPHLNGLIYETLRMHPAVPSAGLRDTPPEGLMVGDTFIPGNTTVLIPQYSLGRRDDCYVDPQRFVPERWYSRPEMVKNKNAFIPFNTGKHNCIGQNLAKMEIRLAVARIVSRFDFQLDSGESGMAVHQKLLDLFVATPGPLRMIFQERSFQEPKV